MCVFWQRRTIFWNVFSVGAHAVWCGFVIFGMVRRRRRKLSARQKWNAFHSKYRFPFHSGFFYIFLAALRKIVCVEWLSNSPSKLHIKWEREKEKFPWKTEIKSSPKSRKKCLIKEKEASTSSRVRGSRRAAKKKLNSTTTSDAGLGEEGKVEVGKEKKCTHKINAFSRLSRLHLSLFSCVNNNFNFCRTLRLS